MKGQRGLHLVIALAKSQVLSSLSKVRSGYLRSVVTLAQMSERTWFILANVILAGLHDLFSFAPHSIAKVGRWPGYSPYFLGEYLHVNVLR